MYQKYQNHTLKIFMQDYSMKHYGLIQERQTI